VTPCCAIAGLSEAQLSFRPQPDSSSIAGCIEHIAVTKDVLFELLAFGAPSTSGVPLDPAKDRRFSAASADRTRKVPAPERVRPSGQFPSADAARMHFRAAHERAINYARDCAGDLRHLFTMHPLLGEIDCYRCLLLLALHPAGHAAQIEEIKRHPEFPSE
jgi:hypothetical protein